jgi:hypothetical protein
MVNRGYGVMMRAFCVERRVSFSMMSQITNIPKQLAAAGNGT